MASKIITLDDRFPTGEPTVQLVSTWGRNGKLLREKTSCHKTAAYSPVEEYMNTVEPEPGKTIVLVVGLGDYETYGPNRNGDGFPSEPIKGKIASDEVLPKHYKTYENAHVFEHHVNSDPSKAIGKVKKAFWNPKMRRVEVIQDFDNEKAPHLLEKIASGDFPAVSMGCRIKYDVCSSCGNKAPSRADYCDELRYKMGQIDPSTGEQFAALNPSPVFFDSSWVIRPADRTGYMLKKVAKEEPYELRASSFDLGELRDDLSAKVALWRKAADIEKIIHGEPAASASALDPSDAKLVERYMSECAPEGTEEDLESKDKIVRMMIAYKPSEAMGTTEGMGLPLGIEELLKYFLGRMAPNQEPEVDPETTKSASQHLEFIYELFGEYPRFQQDLAKEAGLQEENWSFNDELATKLADLGPSNVTQDYFYRRAIPDEFRGQERPLTDPVSWTDPTTGQQYQTTYKNVQDTNDALVEQSMKNKAMTAGPLLAGSALLGGTALGMGFSKKLKGLPQLAPAVASLGLGAAGAGKAMSENTTGPKVLTDQGETISGWTEMRPKQGADTAPELEYIIKRANVRERSVLPRSTKQKLMQSIKSAEIHDDYTPVLGPTLDMEKVAQIIGRSILDNTQ